MKILLVIISLLSAFTFSNVLNAGQSVSLTPFPTDLKDFFVDMSAKDPVIAYSVPDGKHFVLTDLIGYTYGSLYVYEGGVTRLAIPLSGQNSTVPPNYTLKSGLTFGPGSQIEIRDSGAYLNNSYQYGHMALSGYLY